MDDLTGKRGRGRPRKTENKTTGQNETTLRGRSQKQAPPVTEKAAPTEKRGRGRPPGKAKKSVTTTTKRKTKATGNVAALVENDLIIEGCVATPTSSQSSTPAISPSVDDIDIDREQIDEMVLSTPNSTEYDLDGRNNDNSANRNGEFLYQNGVTNIDDFLTEPCKNIDTEGLPNVTEEQHGEISADRHQATPRHPSSIQNRQHRIVQSIKSDYLYYISKYIIPFSILLFTIIHYVHFQTTLRRNGYCDSMYGNNGDMTARGTGFDSSVQRSCLPCPTNGICSGGELFCSPPYCPHRSITNRLRNFVWPTGQTCIKDPTIVKDVMKMERIILNRLAQQQGKQQCHGGYLSTFAPLSSSPRPPSPVPLVKTNVTSIIDYLKHYIALPPTGDQDDSDMDYVMETALDLVTANEHVLSWDINGELYLGTDVARYSFWCWCWTSISIVFGFLKNVLLVLGACLAFWTAYCHWKKRNYDAKVITDKALDILIKQRQMHFLNPQLYDRGCSASTLWTSITKSTGEPPDGIWKYVLKRLNQNHSLNRGYIDKNGETLPYFEYAS